MSDEIDLPHCPCGAVADSVNRLSSSNYVMQCVDPACGWQAWGNTADSALTAWKRRCADDVPAVRPRKIVQATPYQVILANGRTQVQVLVVDDCGDAWFTNLPEEGWIRMFPLPSDAP